MAIIWFLIGFAIVLGLINHYKSTKISKTSTDLVRTKIKSILLKEYVISINYYENILEEDILYNPMKLDNV